MSINNTKLKIIGGKSSNHRESKGTMKPDITTKESIRSCDITGKDQMTKRQMNPTMGIM
jgi:hypothetical protein